ncbi:MAG TPA: uroporphyrinogen decarboxylase [Planctomycetota bacterium]|jgi:uroporphyrinogen decarboxylase|nr:uroporphyrinogen decarboxylase [Planctomycetota bacterium]MDP6409792.1 uroporphyrinogen decarboxylase [Planctomycetota bacterium]HJP00529.1 uroporphyrinogen decarboxylase [Planctomycetota bacterium]
MSDSNDLLLRVLRGERTERRPLWIMRQAGRCLPEYRALRREVSFEELCASPDLAAQVTLQPLERFPFDAAIVFADLMSPVAAMGIDVRFDPGPIVERPLRDAAAVRALRIPDAAEIAPEVPATLRQVKAALDGRAALIGFAGAPLSIAAYLVDGRGGKDFPRLRALLREDPLTFGELLASLAQLSASFLLEQWRAGADVLQVFDSWAGLLEASDWETHVRPHMEALLTELGRAGVPRVAFLNGAPHLARTGALLPSEGLALCWRTDLAALRAELGPGKVLQGNLDPACLLAGPEATRRAASALMAALPAHGHVMNLGHGIHPETPLESIEALIEVVHGEQDPR